MKLTIIDDRQCCYEFHFLMVAYITTYSYGFQSINVSLKWTTGLSFLVAISHTLIKKGVVNILTGLCLCDYFPCYDLSRSVFVNIIFAFCILYLVLLRFCVCWHSLMSYVNNKRLRKSMKTHRIPDKWSPFCRRCFRCILSNETLRLYLSHWWHTLHAVKSVI